MCFKKCRQITPVLLATFFISFFQPFPSNAATFDPSELRASASEKLLISVLEFAKAAEKQELFPTTARKQRHLEISKQNLMRTEPESWLGAASGRNSPSNPFEVRLRWSFVF